MSTVADPEIVSGERPRWGGLWGAVPPPHWGRDRGLSPPHNFFFNFGPQNGQFWCIVGRRWGMHPHPPGSATILSLARLIIYISNGVPSQIV